MPDREKVVKGLECCATGNSVKSCQVCPYYNTKHEGEPICMDGLLIRDAYVLLKEQEPHVLTIDQLEDALDSVVWLDIPGAENLADGYALIEAYSHKYERMFFYSPFGDKPSQDILEYSSYGTLWRCWDRRPTEDQRKAVKWNA